MNSETTLQVYPYTTFEDYTTDLRCLGLHRDLGSAR